MNRDQWTKEIQRVAAEDFGIDPATIALTNWEAYADKYFDEGLSPAEALDADIRENGM